MPSPVGHSLAGIAFSGLGRRSLGGDRRAFRDQVALLVALIFAANAPDLDFLPGILLGDPDRFHHGPSHSLGAALAFAVVAWLGARALRARDAARLGLLMTLAFASHLLLDMLSLDRRPPSGVPLLWPFSGRTFVLPFAVFMDVRREPAAGSFLASVLLRDNFIAALWELVVMGLVLAVNRASWMAGVMLGARTRDRVRAPDPS